jgi:D-aminopeptidase
MHDLEADVEDERGGASITIIYATDVPLSGSQLDRVSKRVMFGLARTGSHGGHGSGDYVIGFSTSFRNDAKPGIGDALRRDEALINVPFQAIAEATEEAILNAVFKATTLIGRDNVERKALPVDAVVERLQAAGVLD